MALTEVTRIVDSVDALSGRMTTTWLSRNQRTPAGDLFFISAGGRVWYSSNNGTSWTEGTALTLASGESVQYVFALGSTICATTYQSGGTYGTGTVYLHVGNADHPTSWSKETVNAVNFPTANGVPNVCHPYVRSDGTIVFLIAGNIGTSMGGDYGQCGVKVRTGTNTYTSYTQVSPGGALTYEPYSIVSKYDGTDDVLLYVTRGEASSSGNDLQYINFSASNVIGSNSTLGYTVKSNAAFGQVYHSSGTVQTAFITGTSILVSTLSSGSMGYGTVSGSSITLGNSGALLQASSGERYFVCADFRSSIETYDVSHTNPNTWDNPQTLLSSTTNVFDAFDMGGAWLIEDGGGGIDLGIILQWQDSSNEYHLGFYTHTLIAGVESHSGTAALGGEGGVSGTGQKFEGDDRVGLVNFSGTGQFDHHSVVVDSSPILSFSGSGTLSLTGMTGSMTWSSALATMPTAEGGAAVVASDGTSNYIWLHGGSASGTGSGTTRLWRYNVSGNSWTSTMATSAVLRTEHVGGFHDGNLYIAVGQDPYPTETWCTTVEKYTVATNTWSTLGGTLPSSGRYHSGGGVHGGKIYSFGGSSDLFSENSTNSVWIYDIATETWSTGTNMPVSLNRPGVAFYDGDAYIVGGYTGSQSGGWTQSYRVYRYDIAANSWEDFAAIPKQSGFTVNSERGVAQAGNGIWLFFNTSGNMGPTPMYFDVPTKKWYGSTRFPSSARVNNSSTKEQWHEANVVFHNNSFYVIGGTYDQWQVAIETYQTGETDKVYKATPGVPNPPSDLVTTTPVQIGNDLTVFWTYNGVGTQTKYQIKYKGSNDAGETTLSEVNSFNNYGAIDTTGLDADTYEVWVRTANATGYSSYSAAGDFLVYDTQDFVGSSSHSGIGTLSSSATVAVSGTTALAGEGAITLFSPQQEIGDVTLAGEGTVSLVAAVELLPPANLTVTVVSPTQLDISWDAAINATGYDLERDGVIISEYQPGTTYSDTGLTEGTTYTYRVRSQKVVEG